MPTLTKAALASLGLLGGALIAVPGAALAQGSVGAPAGTEPATAPGGTEGRAGLRNEREAIRSGDAVPVPPGTAGVPVAPRPAPADVPPPQRP
jgi:hypothetical protein